jgi:transcriptional regulator with XRE-family HTH domain
MVANSGSNVQQVLAANLRRLRIARHLSLSELARATQMSKATLSGVENGRSNPTIETLAALADALRVSLTELLEESGLDDVTIVRAGQAGSSSPAPAPGGIRRRALAALVPGGGLVIAELSLDPRMTHEGTPEAGGMRAHVYVVHGRLLGGPVERVTELTPGDYASFPIDIPYVFETGRQGARILVLTTLGR